MKSEHRICHSQFGEDLAIEAIIQMHRGLAPGTYVDVGAFDPWQYSNTALLHTQHGWSGINIDPNADAIGRFDLARPNDINIASLVGDPSVEREYVRFNHPAVNSADPGMVALQTTEGRPFHAIDKQVMRAVPLSDILASHLGDRSVDLLNIDAEGMDLEVLESSDWARYRPLLIAVEVHSLVLDRPEESPTHRLLKSHGYIWVSHVFATSLFISRR